ncbi:hypothetical protein [Micromonospora sp. WMMD737]|uniref:hypothetical protein n=1 Tax=Micromonospora sp. WMMD737 TaxID=3404113 RepID=UPI003B954884
MDGRRVLLEWAGAVVTVNRASVPGRKVFEEGRIALALGEFADPEAARLAEIAAEESS